MAKIERKDVIEDGLFDDAKKSADELLKTMDKLNEELKETAKLQKKVAQESDNSAKGARDLNNIRKESVKTAEAQEKILKERVKLEQKLKIANSEAIQANVQLKVQLQEQNKVNKQLAREKLKLIGAYEKESKRLIKLRKEYKDLAVQEKANTKEAKALLNEITRLDAKLKGVDASVGQFQRNVGNYTNAFQKLGGTWKNLIGIAGQFGVALGGIAIARDAFSVIVDFDQAVANLQAISGSSAQEIGKLSDQAKELGSSTSFTASEVAGLQTELAKLGFGTGEIEQSTESILKFAKATGSDLSDAAALTGSALRAFGLEASEADRVTSVLGVSTTKRRRTKRKKTSWF